MNDRGMRLALMKLPEPDLPMATKLNDPIGYGAFYRADTVVKLLMKERENGKRNRNRNNQP